MTNDIFEAIDNSDVSRVEYILKYGSDPDQVKAEFVKLRPLHAAIIAVEDGAPLELVIIILRYGANINKKYPDVGGTTPLLCALFNKQLEIARMLLDAGADPNIKGEEGDSPLRWSVDEGNHEMAALLLSKGAWRTIDESGPIEGRTALGMAVHRLDYEMVDMLLAAGANPQRRDLDRRTAKENLPPLTSENDEAWHQIFDILISGPGLDQGPRCGRVMRL